MAGLLAACLVCLLAFGPALDRVICAADEASAASASSSAAPADRASLMASADERRDTPAPGGHVADVCQHGHSHMGESCSPADVDLASVGAAPMARPPIPRVMMPKSHEGFGLDRPPRA